MVSRLTSRAAPAIECRTFLKWKEIEFKETVEIQATAIHGSTVVGYWNGSAFCMPDFTKYMITVPEGRDYRYESGVDDKPVKLRIGDFATRADGVWVCANGEEKTYYVAATGASFNSIQRACIFSSTNGNDFVDHRYSVRVNGDVYSATAYAIVAEKSDEVDKKKIFVAGTAIKDGKNIGGYIVTLNDVLDPRNGGVIESDLITLSDDIGDVDFEILGADVFEGQTFLSGRSFDPNTKKYRAVLTSLDGTPFVFVQDGEKADCYLDAVRRDCQLFTVATSCFFWRKGRISPPIKVIASTAPGHINTRGLDIQLKGEKVQVVGATTWEFDRGKPPSVIPFIYEE